MRLKKHGPPQLRLHCKHCRIEALEMPRLQDALVLYGQVKQFVSLLDRGGDRLFDKQIEPSTKQHGRHSVVMHSGNGNRRRIQVQIRRKQFLYRGEDGDCVGRFRFGSARVVWFHCCNQSDALAGGLKFAVDTKMIAAECAGADDGNPNIAFDCDLLRPFAFHSLQAAPVEL
jgi:hypothetical protein